MPKMLTTEEYWRKQAVKMGKPRTAEQTFKNNLGQNVTVSTTRQTTDNSVMVDIRAPECGGSWSLTYREAVALLNCLRETV